MDHGSDNERKLRIALHLDIFPFINPQEMQQKLILVALRFPSLKQPCEKLLTSRANQGQGI